MRAVDRPPDIDLDNPGAGRGQSGDLVLAQHVLGPQGRKGRQVRLPARHGGSLRTIRNAFKSDTDTRLGFGKVLSLLDDPGRCVFCRGGSTKKSNPIQQLLKVSRRSLRWAMCQCLGGAMGTFAGGKADDQEVRNQRLRRILPLEMADGAPFENVVTLIGQVVGNAIGAVSRVDADGRWFMAKQGFDVCRTDHDYDFFANSVQRPDIFIVPDVQALPSVLDRPKADAAPRIRSYVGIPLSAANGDRVGTLSAIRTRCQPFSSTEIDILRSFARVVADEIQLQQMAMSDLLTGSLCRRAWLDRAFPEVERSRRHGRPLSVGMIDIDAFKAINDTHGHPAGDKVIKGLASLCRSTKRSSDVFGRFGGDEFVLLLPESDTQEALVVAERIRSRFAALPHDLGKPVHATVSIGIAGFGPEAPSLDALIDRADLALYAAKDAGRNRSVIASDG